MRVVRVLGLALAGVLAAGCYTLEPAAGVAPDPGSVVALDINDVGRVALGGNMGPEIKQVEGRLIDKSSSEYVIGVTVVRLLLGGEQTWKGEQVHIKTEYVTSVYKREFSRGRSLALAAVGVGVVAILAGRGLSGSGTGDTPMMHPDTAQTLVRPRP